MLKISLALMLSHGFRPKMQLGHHKTLVNFSKYVLEDFERLTGTYDKMRKTRNKIIYDIINISESQAERATMTAEKYFQVVGGKITQENPQQKLWRP